MAVFGSFLLCGLDTKKAEHRLAVSWCSDLHHSEPHNSILCGQLRLGEPHCGQRRRSKPHCGQLRRSELDPSELRHPALCCTTTLLQLPGRGSISSNFTI